MSFFKRKEPLYARGPLVDRVEHNGVQMFFDPPVSSTKALYAVLEAAAQDRQKRATD